MFLTCIFLELIMYKYGEKSLECRRKTVNTKTEKKLTSCWLGQREKPPTVAVSPSWLQPLSLWFQTHRQPPCGSSFCLFKDAIIILIWCVNTKVQREVTFPRSPDSKWWCWNAKQAVWQGNWGLESRGPVQSRIARRCWSQMKAVWKQLLLLLSRFRRVRLCATP